MDNGGPAYPRERDVYSHHDDNGKAVHLTVSQPGMSLRDYFAAQALAAGLYHVWEPEEYASKCYRIADAMLSARKQEIAG